MQTYMCASTARVLQYMGSASGIIEDIDSGQKEPFHSINELQTMLADSFGKGQLKFPDFSPRELVTHDNAA